LGRVSKKQNAHIPLQCGHQFLSFIPHDTRRIPGGTLTQIRAGLYVAKDLSPGLH